MAKSLFYEIEDPTQPFYYYPLLIFLTLIIMSLKAIIHILKSTSGNPNLEDTLLADVEYPSNLNDRKNSLKYRYLICYILTKSNIWAKTAYLWTLYNKVHGFNVKEIAILYMIDNLSTLIFSPITGNLADIFGRKLFCVIYCLLVVSNLSLRLTGMRSLAYLAQVLTGISATLINTTFESWVNYEASKEFGENKFEKEKFLKKLFKNQTLIDSIVSILASCISAFFYNIYGIKAPIIISMICATLGMISTCILWDENNPNKESEGSVRESYQLVVRELKKREVLTVGLVEGLFYGVFQIYIFAWTPILQLSTIKQDMNVGMVSICIVFMLIIGTLFYEIIIIHFNCNLYIGLSLALLSQCCFFLCVYFIDSFTIRLIFLSMINGLLGYVQPLNSSIKSKILDEKSRALLMSIFRMPISFYVIIILIALQYLDPLILCIICSVMAFLAFLIALSLRIWKPREVHPRNIDEEIEDMVNMTAEMDVTKEN